MGKTRSEEVNRWHKDKPREDAPGKHDGGNFSADDVAHTQIFWCAIGADAAAFQQALRAEVGLVVRAARPEREKSIVLEQGVDAA